MNQVARIIRECKNLRVLKISAGENGSIKSGKNELKAFCDAILMNNSLEILNFSIFFIVGFKLFDRKHSFKSRRAEIILWSNNEKREFKGN